MRHSKLAERTEEVLADPSKIKIKLKVREVAGAQRPDQCFWLLYYSIGPSGGTVTAAWLLHPSACSLNLPAVCSRILWTLPTPPSSSLGATTTSSWARAAAATSPSTMA